MAGTSPCRSACGSSSIAEQVPGGVSRSRSGSAFGPEVDGAEGESTLDRILTILGRSPNWPN
jgi:hypothetical protein